MVDPTFAAELQKHAYALKVSGYTIIPAQLTAQVTQDLCRIADRALEEVRNAMKRGLEVPFQSGSRFYEAANALYCWGDSALDLLEHPTVARVAECLMGSYYLNDLTVFSALPAPRQEACVATSWHRDGCDLDSATPGHSVIFLFGRRNGGERGHMDCAGQSPNSIRPRAAARPSVDVARSQSISLSHATHRQGWRFGGDRRTHPAHERQKRHRVSTASHQSGLGG